MSTPANRRTVRNQRACTNCRQVKLRCDGSQTFPAPCSRCEKSNIKCRRDPNFRRIRTRNRLEEVTSQLNAIQASLGFANTHTQLATLPASASPPIQSASSQPSLTAPSQQVSQQTSHFYLLDELPDTACLGQTILETNQIVDLLQYFEIHYYRHCPILDTDVTIKALYHSSPILFWTIIMIACRWHPSLYSLHAILLEEYRMLLARTLLEPIHVIESTQALLFRCVWPLPVARQIDDPTWNYCGLVTNAAVKMGLNSSRGDTKDISPAIASVKRKTWMACVQVNCMAAWYAGRSVSPEILSSFLAPPMCAIIEKEFEAKVQILRKFAQSSAAITGLHRDMNSWLFVSNLCRDLDDLRDACQAEWTEEMSVLISGAQLHLYMLQIERRSTSDNEREAASSHLKIINLAYMTTTRLIRSFSTMLEAETIEDHIPQRHLPKVYFGLLLLAMAFMFKAKMHHTKELQLSQDGPEEQIRSVHDILRSMSREQLDEPWRAVRLINIITRAEKERQLKLKDSTGDGRPGLRILDEMISTAKAIRESEDSHGEKLAVPSDETISGSALFGNWQQSVLDWDFPWELDLSMLDQSSINADLASEFRLDDPC